MARAVTHVVVIGLVASASALGIAAVRGGAIAGTATDAAALLPFDLVTHVRGAGNGASGAEESSARTTTYQLEPDPAIPAPSVARRMVRIAPTPLPTPVAPPPPAPDPPVVVAAPAAPPPTDVVGSGVLIWPVPGGQITTYFSSYHLAVDIAAPYGAGVQAADGGVVTWAGWRNNGGGLVVAIDHGNGISTVYNHLGSILVGPGQAVGKGDTIAAVGCTGVCTGPHVHFEVIVGGVLVNPLRYL